MQTNILIAKALEKIYGKVTEQLLILCTVRLNHAFELMLPSKSKLLA